MLMMTWLIGCTDSHEGLIARMDCAGKSDFAKGVHKDDEIQPRTAQGDRFRAWVAHARLILPTDCTRMVAFAHSVSTDDGFWGRIALEGGVRA